jgi:hypothetical protein
MPKPRFKVPYPRPKQFSDPFNDHWEHCTSLILTRDDLLQPSDIEAILGPTMPAGTYEESVYFLPFAFDMLMSSRQDTMILISPIVGFCSINAERLKNDGVLDDVRREISNCLTTWTTTFSIYHRPGDEMTHEDWFVTNSTYVYEMLHGLAKFKAHSDLALAHVHRFVNHENNPIRAGWHLEIAWYQTLSRHFRIKHADIEKALMDYSLLKSSANVILKQEGALDRHLPYWDKVFKQLAL